MEVQVVAVWRSEPFLERSSVCVCAKVFNLIFEVLLANEWTSQRWTIDDNMQHPQCRRWRSSSSGTPACPFVYMSITHFSFQVENLQSTWVQITCITSQFRRGASNSNGERKHCFLNFSFTKDLVQWTWIGEQFTNPFIGGKSAILWTMKKKPKRLKSIRFSIAFDKLAAGERQLVALSSRKLVNSVR